MRLRFVSVCGLVVARLFVADGLHAQSPCPPVQDATTPTARPWPSPLDRVVSFHAVDIELRDALDRLAASTRLRLSYSAEALPLDRRACVSVDAAPLGDVLVALLRGAGVEPRAVGVDHVALAPVYVGGRAAAESVVPRAAPTLDPVVVKGSANEGRQRPLAVAMDVLTGADIERTSFTGALSQAFDGAVPGLWVWEQPPSSLFARYGSIRGASSFGASYPKVYVDGIEVANSLLVTHLTPGMIERLEVIRGPQGAALYGTDAMSGVINIITRTDGPTDGGVSIDVRSDVGTAGTDFSSQTAVAQRYAVALHVGSSTRSGALGLTASSVGAYLPDAYSRQMTLTGAGRVVGSRSILSGTMRVVAMDSRTPVNPVLSALGSVAPDLSEASFPQSLRQYTLGTTATFMDGERWTHSAVLGLDGYRLRGVGVTNEVGWVPSAVDPDVRDANGSANRATLRMSSVGRWGSSERASASLTLAAEHSVLRQESVETIAYAPGGPVDAYGQAAIREWRTNTGFTAQANTAFRDVLHLTTGLRLERNGGFLAADHWTLLPMLGAAVVRDHGDVSVKLRAAYGQGIRPPRTPMRGTMWTHSPGQSTAQSGGTSIASSTGQPTSPLDPERQSGIEAGVDLFIGRALTFRITRFDQLASGLSQRVAVAVDTSQLSAPGLRRVGYAHQNVGEIENHGWEMEGSITHRSLSLSGTLSLVDSRVRAVAPGYSGDLRPGDRMLGVPARTMGLTATWQRGRSSLSVSGVRAADWVNYDRIALASASMDGALSPEELGVWLRGFWRTYDGVTRIRAMMSRDVGRGISLVLTGDNLLDRQRGEPDNITIVPGRTLTVGMRAEF